MQLTPITWVYAQEQAQWTGTPGDLLRIRFYISPSGRAENEYQLLASKGLMQQAEYISGLEKAKQRAFEILVRYAISICI